MNISNKSMGLFITKFRKERRVESCPGEPSHQPVENIGVNRAEHER